VSCKRPFFLCKFRPTDAICGVDWPVFFLWLGLFLAKRLVQFFSPPPAPAGLVHFPALFFFPPPVFPTLGQNPTLDYNLSFFGGTPLERCGFRNFLSKRQSPPLFHLSSIFEIFCLRTFLCLLSLRTIEGALLSFVSLGFPPRNLLSMTRSPHFWVDVSLGLTDVVHLAHGFL